MLVIVQPARERARIALSWYEGEEKSIFPSLVTTCWYDPDFWKNDPSGCWCAPLWLVSSCEREMKTTIYRYSKPGAPRPPPTLQPRTTLRTRQSGDTSRHLLTSHTTPTTAHNTDKSHSTHSPSWDSSMEIPQIVFFFFISFIINYFDIECPCDF